MTSRHHLFDVTRPCGEEIGGALEQEPVRVEVRPRVLDGDVAEVDAEDRQKAVYVASLRVPTRQATDRERVSKVMDSRIGLRDPGARTCSFEVPTQDVVYEPPVSAGDEQRRTGLSRRSTPWMIDVFLQSPDRRRAHGQEPGLSELPAADGEHSRIVTMRTLPNVDARPLKD